MRCFVLFTLSMLVAKATARVLVRQASNATLPVDEQPEQPDTATPKTNSSAPVDGSTLTLNFCDATRKDYQRCWKYEDDCRKVYQAANVFVTPCPKSKPTVDLFECHKSCDPTASALAAGRPSSCETNYYNAAAKCYECVTTRVQPDGFPPANEIQAWMQEMEGTCKAKCQDPTTGGALDNCPAVPAPGRAVAVVVSSTSDVQPNPNTGSLQRSIPSQTPDSSTPSKSVQSRSLAISQPVGITQASRVTPAAQGAAVTSGSISSGGSSSVAGHAESSSSGDIASTIISWTPTASASSSFTTIFTTTNQLGQQVQLTSVVLMGMDGSFTAPTAISTAVPTSSLTGSGIRGVSLEGFHTLIWLGMLIFWVGA